MEKVKTFFQGILAAGILAAIVHGGGVLWGFRNDYLKIRAEHAQMYAFLAGVVAEQQGKPISRAAVLEMMIKQGLTPKKD